MLSVLIPVYNYDIRLLVRTVHEQLLASQITFEIICLDDASKSGFSTINSEINTLAHVAYHSSSKNSGRVATRQALAKQAKYDWLLFLDADVIPKSETFITDYLSYTNSNYEAVYGGFIYTDETPKAEHLLRWTYGKSNEQVVASKRNKTPYRIVISANFMIKKQLFLDINSEITQRGYGYDNYFGALLKTKKSAVFHTDNEVYHQGLESNESYLNKIEQSVDTLLKLDAEHHINATENRLLETFKTLKQWKLNYVFSWTYKAFKNRFKSNLLGKHPRLWVLQCYKLSYICYQDLNA